MPSTTDEQTQRGDAADERDALADRTQPLRRPWASGDFSAILVGLIGLAGAIPFNWLIWPTDGPGPIGLATVIILIVMHHRTRGTTRG